MCQDKHEDPLGYVDLIVCDGGLVGTNGKAEAVTYAYRYVDSNDNVIKEVSGVTEDFKTSPQAEALCIILALEGLPEGVKPRKVESDCLFALKVIFRTNYHDGLIWRDKNLDPRLKERRDRLDLEGIEIELLKGHPSKADILRGTDIKGRKISLHNVAVDEECTRQGQIYKSQSRASLNQKNML